MEEHDITLIRHLPIQVSEVFEQEGGSMAAALKTGGTTVESLRQIHYRMPHDQFRAMLTFCTEELAKPEFGLLVGTALKPLSFSSLGISCLASDTAVLALQRLSRFATLLATGAKGALDLEGDCYVIRLRGARTQYTSAEEVDLVASSLVRLVGLTINEDIKPVKVALKRGKPADPSAWYHVFGNRIVWDAPETSIYLQKEPLQAARLSANEALARANDDYTQKVIDDLYQSDFIRRVNEKIALHLPDGPPNQSQIASELAMSARTLQRRLKDEDTHFSKLVVELRKNLAVNALRNGSRSIAEVAFQLGYAEHSTFSRAFKGWMGMSPQEFVERCGS
jgi:AraC-like DNA-binding protein